MARYLPVLRIEIGHEYLAGAPLLPRFQPCAASAARMRREDVLLRHTPHGAELWRAQPSAGAAPVSIPLGFTVNCDDPQLPFCTAWPVAPPLRFVLAGGAAPRAETLAGSGAPRQALLTVEIDALPAIADAGVPVTYRIDLAARKLHWKYYFSGSLASRKLCIVDLDAEDGAGGIGFAASAAALGDGAAWTSKAPLPMQKIPQQRLQLREQGGAGKVLIRRLPNADVAKLGKERGRDGESMIVAEIYIHQ